MFDFLAGAFDTVVGWVTGDGGGGVVSAVVDSAIKTAVTGVVIGAASAAIQGEDILEGALKGAGIGALAGGVLGVLSGITDTAQETAKISEPEQDVSQPQSLLAGKSQAMQDYANKDITSTVKTQSTAPTAEEPIMRTQQPSMDTTQAKSFWSQDDTKMALLKGGSEMLKGLASPDAKEIAEAKAAGDIAVLNRKAEIDREKIAANRPSNTNFKTQISNIQHPTAWWSDKISGQVQKPTVERQGVAV